MMLRRSGLWRPLVRVVVVASTGGVLVYGAQALPGSIDVPGANVEGVEAAPPEGATYIEEQVRACPGPEQQGLEDSSVQEREQEVRVRAGAAPESVVSAPQEASAIDPDLALNPVPAAEGEPTQTQDRGELLSRALTGPVALSAVGTGPLAPGLIAGQQFWQTTEQARGLAAHTCVQPQTEAWLTAGGGQAGRQERLVLVNPGGNPVTVNVEVYGASGTLEAPGGSGIVVGAGEREVLLVDALAPQEESPVLHVQTQGGPVSAALGDRWLEGTNDRGMELSGPMAPPQESHVIPGLDVPSDGGSAVVRVLVPGQEQAVLQVRGLTDAGPVGLSNDVTRADGGSVAEIAVDDLPAGVHGIELSSDVPVVAAAATQHGNDDVSDVAWTPAALPISEVGGAFGVRLGDQDVTNTLALAALEATEVDVRWVAADGQERDQQVEVAAASLTPLDMQDAVAVWIRSEGAPVYASVLSSVAHDSGPFVTSASVRPSPVSRDLPDLQLWRP